MWWSSVLLLLFIAPCYVDCDCYGHTPRFSNNRLDGTGRERTTNNRIFDSQNNARAGYNVGGAKDRLLVLSDVFQRSMKLNGTGVRVKMEEEEGPAGKMKYYEGSVVDVTWTDQHQCGGKGEGQNTRCEIIVQYMCDDKLRDGIEDKRIPEDVNDCHIGEDKVTKNCDEDRRYGMHEDLRYYTLCKNTKRNGRLYRADQALANRFTAKYTRQNNNGNRNGYECPEERDYYPYWRPTPWIDVAIMTDNVARCEEYKRESENVKRRHYCKVPETLIKKLIAEKKEDQRIPITQEECVKFEHEGVKGQWVQDDRPISPAPECIPSPKNRDNHHGNKPDGFFNSYNWTIPNTPHKHCTLRIRYNITTFETPWSKAHDIADTPQLKAAKKLTLRCTTQGGCCTTATPCNAGEGDCNRDTDCAEGLICGRDNSPRNDDTDICVPDLFQTRGPVGASLITATASSTRNPKTTGWLTKYAFTGRSKGGMRFFQSAKEDNPWVRMQITPTTLSSITVINRRDSKGDQLKNVEVRAGTSSQLFGNPIVGTIKGPGVTGEEYYLPFQPVMVEYITIQQKGVKQILQVNGIKLNEKYSRWGAAQNNKKCTNTYTCDGFYRVDLQTCKMHCQNNDVPVGCKVDGNPVCNYISLNTRTGVCQLATTCTTATESKGVVRQIVDRGNPLPTDPIFYPPRCRGENNNCCTDDKPCDFGEGDCDTDSQCSGALVCGFDNCPFDATDDCCTVNDIASMIGGDAVEAKKRGFAYKNDPTVQPLKLQDGDDNLGKLLNLDLAINTAQFGRTFQDRTHEFSILKRPWKLKDKKIYNMEVRGKRGNIVQVYPATEYDYSPNRLEVVQGDYVHMQWTGSERNPQNNAGNGRKGYDRNNMLLLGEQVYPEGTIGAAIAQNLKNGHWGRSYPAGLTNDGGKTLFGWTNRDRGKLALSSQGPFSYKCLDGTEALARSSKHSYYCVFADQIKGYTDEHRVMEKCNLDPQCTGYDYSDKYEWGRTCKQTSYPGSSVKGAEHGYKLCQKVGPKGSIYDLSQYRCNGQDDGCCTTATPCEVDEGDCDNHNQCKGTLKCGNNNCIWEDKDDCCYDPALRYTSEYRCNGQDDGCCTAEKPCDLHEGDCDKDSECKGRLVCGTDNCIWGDNDDCCREPSYLDLDAAPLHFDMGPKELTQLGEFKYMCSRNNDFSNRSQKGKVKVSASKKKDSELESEVSALKEDMNEILHDIEDMVHS